MSRYAPLLWAKASAPLLRWLHRTLRRLKPTLDRLVIERRVIEMDPEVIFLANAVQALSLDDPTPELAVIFTDFGEEIALLYGFLPDDPRFELIEQYSQRILSDDLSAFWQSLTEPEALARRLVDMRREGMSYTAMSRQIDHEYRTGFYRAERLVRSSYNSASNFAHHQDLVAQGYTHIRWLTARDARVRSGGRSKFNHRQMDGVIVRIGEPFVVNGERLMFPGDRSMGASAGNVINCRCTVIGMYQ